MRRNFPGLQGVEGCLVYFQAPPSCLLYAASCSCSPGSCCSTRLCCHVLTVLTHTHEEAPGQLQFGLKLHTICILKKHTPQVNQIWPLLHNKQWSKSNVWNLDKMTLYIVLKYTFKNIQKQLKSKVTLWIGYSHCVMIGWQKKPFLVLNATPAVLRNFSHKNISALG